MHVGRMELKH